MGHLPNINDKEFLNEVIRLLSWAHHRFLWIHPFRDYNGRIGRLLISILLLNLNLPPVELKVETPSGRKKYVNVLEQADNGDYTGLEKLVTEAINEAGKELS